MSLPLLTAFFAVCVLVSQPKPERTLRAWALHVGVCIGVGWVLAAVFTILISGMSGIDPNAGQHM